MANNSEKNLLEQVLEYDRYGWCIIPIRTGTKKPAVRSWKQYQQTRPDTAKLRKWFGNGKYKSLAVVCGAVSGGLTVLDFDSMAVYDKLYKKHSALLDKLPKVKTARGMHVFFNSNLNKSRKFEGVDLISEKKYAMLPPSVHPSDCKYEWLKPLNGELPEFDISALNLGEFTEEREETDDIEEIEDIKEIEAISCVCIVYSELESRLKNNVDDAIKNTLPDNRGYRNFLIFQFCRWLKGMEEFERLPAKALKDIAREWHRQALDYIGTKPFDETWADFAYGWPRVKYPKGDDMLKLATKKALNPKTKLVIESQYDAPETQLLIRVCHELQLIQQDEPFWLSCYDAGGILGLSHTEANKRLQMLVADEILRVIEKNTTKRATRYRYIAN